MTLLYDILPRGKGNEKKARETRYNNYDKLIAIQFNKNIY